MSRYVIENCPCYNKDYSCQSKANITGKYCKDCTNCIMKQIVEKCKNTQFLSTKNRQDLYAVKVFANDLLQLLDIQVE